eukprot:GILK01006177.1.p1 GENE.GILK01006177.1~~GILK01006177.1.p1  ORF type:complete len:985 (+),score=231.47 GILK01006177.1:102-2957(+)
MAEEPATTKEASNTTSSPTNIEDGADRIVQSLDPSEEAAVDGDSKSMSAVQTPPSFVANHASVEANKKSEDAVASGQTISDSVAAPPEEPSADATEQAEAASVANPASSPRIAKVADPRLQKALQKQAEIAGKTLASPPQPPRKPDSNDAKDPKASPSTASKSSSKRKEKARSLHTEHKEKKEDSSQQKQSIKDKSTDVKPKQVIWCRYPGFPWWPGLLVDPRDPSLDPAPLPEVIAQKRSGRLLVLSLGDYLYSWVGPNDVVGFKENFNKHSTACLKTKSGKLAVLDALDELKWTDNPLYPSLKALETGEEPEIIKSKVKRVGGTKNKTASNGKDKSNLASSNGKPNAAQSESAKGEVKVESAQQSHDLQQSGEAQTEVQEPIHEAVQVKEAEEEDHNEDLCHRCRKTGDLVCCDSCPKSFHLRCMKPPLSSLEALPEGDWFCHFCVPPPPTQTSVPIKKTSRAAESSEKPRESNPQLKPEPTPKKDRSRKKEKRSREDSDSDGAVVPVSKKRFKQDEDEDTKRRRIKKISELKSKLTRPEKQKLQIPSFARPDKEAESIPAEQGPVHGRTGPSQQFADRMTLKSSQTPVKRIQIIGGDQSEDSKLAPSPGSNRSTNETDQRFSKFKHFGADAKDGALKLDQSVRFRKESIQGEHRKRKQESDSTSEASPAVKKKKQAFADMQEFHEYIDRELKMNQDLSRLIRNQAMTLVERREEFSRRRRHLIDSNLPEAQFHAQHKRLQADATQAEERVKKETRKLLEGLKIIGFDSVADSKELESQLSYVSALLEREAKNPALASTPRNKNDRRERPLDRTSTAPPRTGQPAGKPFMNLIGNDSVYNPLGSSPVQPPAQPQRLLLNQALGSASQPTVFNGPGQIYPSQPAAAAWPSTVHPAVAEGGDANAAIVQSLLAALNPSSAAAPPPTTDTPPTNVDLTQLVSFLQQLAQNPS